MRKSVDAILSGLGVLHCFDAIMSTDDVTEPKPSPEIYNATIATLGCKSGVIVEDSDVGERAARATGWPVLRVSGPEDVTLGAVTRALGEPWVNIVIPMAGHGSRFAKAGYKLPKPLIDVDGRPMIQVVIEDFAAVPGAHFIFAVQTQHIRDHGVDETLKRLAPGCDIVEIHEVTEGAACTVMLCDRYIDPDLPLMTANSDQKIVWNPECFFEAMHSADGGILTFTASDPKWSFAKRPTARWSCKWLRNRSSATMPPSGCTGGGAATRAQRGSGR